VEHEKQLSLELDNDALAETLKPDDGSTRSDRQRGLDGAQKKGARKSYARQRPAEHPRLERFKIYDDVREFRHVKSRPRSPMFQYDAIGPSG
jgi:hypothetical protein